MKMKQYCGPFEEDAITLNLSNVIYIKIGIEYPHSIPISCIQNDNFDNFLTVGINKDLNQSEHDFIITEKDILELYLEKQNLKIDIYKPNNPYMIITVLYDNMS